MAGFLGAKPVILSTTAATVGGNMTVSGTSTLGDDVTITGEIDVDSVTDGTTSVPTGYVVNGSAKVWACLNGTSTIALRDSFNISSAADNGVGIYTYTYTNAMINTDYQTNGAAWGNTATVYWSHFESTGSRTTTSIQFKTVYGNATTPTTLGDNEYDNMSLNGDLA